MKRKISAPRNHFVAAAKFRKAGVHGRRHKAMRRAEKMADGELARRSSIRLLTDRQGFDSLTPYQATMKSVLMCASKQGVGA